ncbi:hypothetical protein Nham_4635 (plasmid) [Nitrobacter hamburgensis X14]|uniref:RND transporter n=1 Tax=Nitrobacter hamburgensis (strain DSM 10229 / NCIMB 13809 / X14) TaxID=323097 RepID=Q1QF03_NITHX|nr:copper-binding protein [Nitrobacter hamburgensis]ABE65194.1 hypothetical protein Nham_4635 [Nitrobacter hamburgensis X14]
MKPTNLASAVFVPSLFAPLAASAQAMAKGAVKKVDVAGAKITMTSGPIKNLDMEDDNMTTVFRVEDPAMRKQVKPGDKVQFETEKASAGFTIAKLQRAK